MTLRTLSLPALALLSGCGLDMAGMLDLPDPGAYEPDEEVPTEEATVDSDEEGRGGGFPAMLAMSLDVGSTELVGVSYEVEGLALEFGEAGWRSVTLEATAGTDEMVVEAAPFEIIADTITGFRLDFASASAVVGGASTALEVGPLEAAGSWGTEDGAAYTFTLAVTGAEVEVDTQGIRWDASLTVEDWTEVVDGDTGQ